MWVREYVKEFRLLLKKYTGDENQDPLFPTHPDGNPRTAEFDEAVRSLAQFGKKLYLGIFQEVEADINDDLRDIREGQDLTLQIARHRGNAVFPWSVIYDFIAPSEGHALSAPVCRGAALPDAPLAVKDGLEKVRGCPHNPGREVYCVRGVFGGFRHRIEQITPAGRAAQQRVECLHIHGCELCVSRFQSESVLCTALSVELQGTLRRRVRAISSASAARHPVWNLYVVRCNPPRGCWFY